MIKHVAAILLILAALLVLPIVPALAQGVQSAPIAAPTGPAADTQSLAPPPGAPASSAGMGGDVGGTFNIVSMFLRADIIVKAVMILLLLASLWSWTIIFNKLWTMGSLKRKARRFEKLFWSGQSLDELYQQFAARNDHPLAAMFIAGLREWRRAFEGSAPLRESMIGGVKERIDKAMSVTILRESDGIEKNLGVLATIGSVSPFVGLFGTVWGIMNSFGAIAARHDTTLAVVAPGIAEALFATAMGLLAAIPAVIFYNRFVSEIGRYVNQLDAFADEFSAILSRQLDEKARLMAGGIQHTSSRGRGRMRRRAMAEINVTPFVDVMLVLLIVFMVTAPLLTVGVPVDLPKTKAPALGQDREPLSITVRRDGAIFLQKEQVPQAALVDKLTAIASNGYNQRIFVRGDDRANYGKVMEVMGLLASAGFTHIGLVTDVVKPKPDAP